MMYTGMYVCNANTYVDYKWSAAAQEGIDFIIPNCFVFFIAPVCFNTTYCGGQSISNNSVSFQQCCFELFAKSFASPGQCLLCPKSGNLIQ